MYQVLTQRYKEEVRSVKVAKTCPHRFLISMRFNIFIHAAAGDVAISGVSSGGVTCVGI